MIPGGRKKSVFVLYRFDGDKDVFIPFINHFKEISFY